MQIISTKDPTSVREAINVLKNGGMVIYPTETCYGIAVDVTNRNAVTKLLAYKGDRHRQVSIAVSNRDMAQHYVELNTVASNLYQNFLPGPITVISQSLKKVDPRLESVSGSLGIRYPNHSYTLRLITQFGGAITATSANTSGKKEPYSLTDWQKYTTKPKQAMVDLFLDAGALTERPTSTVVDTTLNSPEILRQGEIFLPNTPVTIQTTKSVEETIALGQSLTKKYLNTTLKYPLIFALQGDLGVGKTQLSKGIALALGITDTIASPTYTLLHEYFYQTPKYHGMFYHLDTWRLPDSQEIESTLHLSTLLKTGNILSMEWAAKANDLLKSYKEDCLIIYIEIKEKDYSTRTITYTVSHPEWT